MYPNVTLAPAPNNLKDQLGVVWPWIILLAAVLILFCRWAWVAGFGDFGWTYEPAFRISLGEMQYRDFIFTGPPLESYTLAAFLTIFGKSLWLWSIHLYLWWFFSLAVGLLILNHLRAPGMVAVSAVLLAATISAPFTAAGHAHNYAATALGGLVILFVLRYQRSHKGADIALAGLFAGLCIFAKQNVGVFISFTGLVGLLYVTYLSEHGKKTLGSLGWFLGGWLVGFLPPLLFFGIKAGLFEVVRQLFLDAVGAKGGMLTMMVRWIPREVIAMEIPHQRLVEGAISLVIYAAFFTCFWVSWRRLRSPEPLRELGGQTAETPSRFMTLVGLYFIVLIALSLVSLFPAPHLKHILNLLDFGGLPLYPDLMKVIFYIGTLALAIFCLFMAPLRRQADIMLVAILMVGLGIAHTISDFRHCGETAPVTIPLFIYLLYRTRLWPRVSSAGVMAGMVVLCCYFLFSSSGNKTFVPLVKLPSASPFAGFYADPPYADFVQTLLTQVTPRIKGKKILWLCYAGPHAAFGGLPVVNVPNYFANTYNVRSEKALQDRWQQDPPDFIVFAPLTPGEQAPGTKIFAGDLPPQWVQAHYLPVWQGELQQKATEPGVLFSLWQRKP
jgi:hypothetical protein